MTMHQHFKEDFLGTFFIPENEKSGVFLVQCMEINRSLGLNRLTSYSITEENLFSFDSSGIVRTSSSLDSEITSSYTLTLTASDSGQSQLSTNFTLVVVVGLSFTSIIVVVNSISLLKPH